MKKILFVATVQSHIMNFHIPYLKYWQEKGYEVHVATNMDIKKYKNIEGRIQNIIWNNIDFARNPFTKNTVIALKQLITLMKTNKYELVHVHTPVGGILGRLAAKISNTNNVVYTAHGFHFYKGAPIQNWLIYYPIEKFMARYTDAIITMNDEDYKIAYKKFKTRIKNNIFKVNGVGIDLNRYNISNEKDIDFKKSLNLEEEDFIITVIAELSKRKNHMQLLKAMKEIIKTHPDIKAIFVGDGNLYNHIEEYIKEHRLEKNIILLGFRNDVEKILNITDVVGLFSYQEGLPKNIMEGMVAKKSIICTNIRGNKDLVIDGENGYLININDINTTIDKVKDLYENKMMRLKFENNNSLLIKKYSISNVIKDIEDIYEKIIL